MFLRQTMENCDADFTYCTNGCCENKTITCCNVTCGSTTTYCMKSTDDGGEFSVGSLFGYAGFLFFCVVGFLILKSFCKAGKEFCSDICSGDCDCCDCLRNISCDCFDNCDTDKCMKCIGCICLSPCLLVNWLRQEWKDYSSRSQQNRDSQNTETPVVVDQPRDHPIQQTNINISVYNGHGRDSSISSSESENSDIYSITTNMQLPSSNHGGNGTADNTAPPPSYYEATKDDPPTYFEAHNYPVDDC